MEAEEQKTELMAVRTTVGQERNVAELIEDRAKDPNIGIKAILVPSELQGYIIVEAMYRDTVENLLSGIPHVRGVLDGTIDPKELDTYFEMRSAVSGIDKGDVVEIISGPFKGERAKVIMVDESKEEVKVELFEATVPIPVTIRGDHIRVLEKEEKR